MSSTLRTRRNHREYTVALVFAMSVELWAFRHMLDELHQPLQNYSDDPNTYHLGEVCGHNAVLVCLPGEQGNNQAARVGTNLSRTFPNIAWRLLVGVGGGISNEQHHIRLGDVVISMPSGTYGGVGQYDLGRDTPDEFQRKGIIHHPPEKLRGIVEGMKEDILEEESKMRSFLSDMLNKDPRIMERYKRPPTETDVLFPDDVLHTAAPGQSCTAGCDTAKAIAHTPRQPEGEPKPRREDPQAGGRRAVFRDGGRRLHDGLPVPRHPRRL